MIPREWNAALAANVRAREANATVATRVRELLAHDVRFHDDSISTNELVEILYPAQYARGEGITARNRLFKCLFALTTRELSDCCTRGPASKTKSSVGFMHNKRPWLWHHPTVPNGEIASNSRLSLKGCPAVLPRPTTASACPVSDHVLDNDWIDANFDAVIWFLKRMTENNHADHSTDTRKAA